MLEKDGSSKLGGNLDVDSDSATALAVSTLAGAFVSVCGCIAGSAAALSATVPLGGVGVWESVSMDAGLALLLRRHVDLPSLALTSVLEGFAGGLETSPSAIGVGCASEPSPMTAISPDSGSGTLPSFLGESLDQNAQVEPAFGAGSGSDFGGGGGASSMTTSSGSLAVASLGAESCFTDGALLELPRNPNQDDDGGGGSLFGGSAGGCSAAVWAGGVLGLPSSAVSSGGGGGGGLAISASDAVFGVRDHQPSQLPVVGGRSGVAAGAAPCCSGTSWLPSLLSAAVGFDSGWSSCFGSSFAAAESFVLG